jgi:raffinose/stachyose/melibiose transport system substrate-binding protein
MNSRPVFLLVVAGFLSAMATPALKADALRETVTLRFVHNHLEPGVREALDAIASEYTARHPDIRVEQLAIPSRMYLGWVRTQFAGDTAPDIVEVGYPNTPLFVSTNFEPLGAVVAAPNPYNQGTKFGNTAWKNTFIDNLSGIYTYHIRLQEYFGVSLTLTTERLAVNRELWDRALGHDAPLPTTYAEFMRSSEQLSGFYAGERKKVFPLLLYSDEGRLPVQEALFGQMMQRLTFTLDSQRDWSAEGWITHMGRAFLDQKWTEAEPAVTEGLSVMNQLSTVCEPGFEQMNPEDAVFLFLSGHGVMLPITSNMAGAVQNGAPFPIEFVPYPSIEHDSPTYYRNVLGPITEIGRYPSFSLGINRRSRNKEAALDFLRFATSIHGNQIFAQKSSWLPSVKDISPSAATTAFYPRPAGVPAGVLLQNVTLATLGDGTRQHFLRTWHLLFRSRGSEAEFRHAFFPTYAEHIADDFVRQAQAQQQILILMDMNLAGLRYGMPQNGPASNTSHKINNLEWALLLQESERYANQAAVRRFQATQQGADQTTR